MSSDFWLLHITTGKPQASLCKSWSSSVTHRAHSYYGCKESHTPSAILKLGASMTNHEHCVIIVFCFLMVKTAADTHHVADAYRRVL